MTMNFTPIGERARWEILYEELADKDFGHRISYARMAELLELSDGDRHSMQVAMRRAAKELAVENARHVQAVRGVGYEIVDLAEQVQMTRRGKKKADRALVLASRPVQHVDQAALAASPAGVQLAFKQIGQVMEALAYVHHRAELRSDRIERTVDLVRLEQRGDREEINRLKERLARLEALSIETSESG